jgi:aryl-alcohol dehydrogenase-like predicted oxidoreductase
MGEDQLEIKSICDSLGIRVIAYSPLGLGMLTGKYSPTKLPTGPRCVDIYAMILQCYLGPVSIGLFFSLCKTTYANK